MREKRRYIYFKIELGRNLTETEARDEIYRAILSFAGEFGFSKASPKLIEFRDNSGVLLCSNAETQKVKAALALVGRIKGEEGCIRVLRVSGMMCKLR